MLNLDLHPWTWTVATLLLAGLLVRFYLAQRQMKHVWSHRHLVPAAFADTIDLPSHQKAAAYTVAKTQLSLWDALLSALTFVGWTWLGGLDALNAHWDDQLGPGLVQQLTLVFSVLAIEQLVHLPLDWKRVFGLETHFGFNRMTPRMWLADHVKGAVMGLLIGVPLLSALLWVMAHVDLWWLGGWGMWVVFSLTMLLVYPTWIAPRFNRFTPMAEGDMRQRIETLMARCGFRSGGLFVMDNSKRSGHGNAYFTGLGPVKRVVFFDTLLERLSPDEIEAVLAHELGHFKHKHVTKRLVLSFVTSGLGFALLGLLSQRDWFYDGLGVSITPITHPQALALILFAWVLPLFTFFISPVVSQLSRRDEFEADDYAVSHSSATALAQALVKLYRDNASTLTPDPWFVRYYHSHPPASERVGRLLTPLPA